MTEQNLALHIANQLRRDILRGKLLPGTSIKERDNAAELGVSRTPLREAIRILAQEGLISLRPARSPIVSRPSVKQISDDVEVLLAVEKLSGELACVRATEADLAKLAAMVDDMDARFDNTDPVEMFEADMRFHSAIAEAAHNEPLADIHRTFLSRLWRARFLAAMQRRNRERVIDHHRGIVNALRARDSAAVLDAIRLHLDNLGNDILRAIALEIVETDTSGDTAPPTGPV